MARPTLGDEPLTTTIRVRLSRAERQMLAELTPSGGYGAFLRGLIHREHALLSDQGGDSV